jgi:hypothetical protein
MLICCCLTPFHRTDNVRRKLSFRYQNTLKGRWARSDVISGPAYERDDRRGSCHIPPWKPATGTANSMREPGGGQLIAAPSPQHEPGKLAF